MRIIAAKVIKYTMKIAIFGGAFNPVHLEHVNIAKAAVKQLKLDKLIVVPTATSPHKSGKLTASAADRLAMCRLAFACVKGAEVSAYEIEQGGVSYSYLTCAHFRREYPDAELYFLVGADMLENFPHWKNPQEILENVTLAACARENKSAFSRFKTEVESAFSTRVKKVTYVGANVSSTRIRSYAALGEEIGAYVPKEIGQYIVENNLYGIARLQRVKSFLKPKRWAHTVRVAAMCAKYADRADLSEEQAITMGALHDVAKNLPDDSPYLVGFSLPDGVPSPVVHQFAGAYVAANTFGIADKTLLDAIACHTSARPAMTKADTLLYLCDMLEEGRDFPGVNKLRKLFEKDMDYCLFVALRQQVEYLASTGAPVYGLTREAYDYLKEKYHDNV